MPALDRFSIGAILLASTFLLFAANPALAYIGPGADLGFVSYFMSLLAWAGLAFSASLLWPIYALARYLRGGKKATPAETPTAPALEKSGELVSASSSAEL
jgi:hypothetical protein